MARIERGETRDRIVEAATEVFGRSGFKAATVRGICSLAKANVASLHYHFGSKEGLYRAVLEGIFAQGFARFPMDLGVAPDAGPEERLRGFVRAFVLRLLSPEAGCGDPQNRAQLLVKEMADPSPVMQTVIEMYAKPQKEYLFNVVREILGPGAGLETVLYSAMSVAGQCLHYVYARRIIRQIAPEIAVDGNDAIERIAGHVARFSLGGLAAVRAAENQGEGRA